MQFNPNKSIENGDSVFMCVLSSNKV